MRKVSSLVSNALGTACITGASAGIGHIYADRLAARGYDLILVARRGDALAVAAAELGSAYGVDVQTIVADLSDKSDLGRVASALAANERLTMLVNNAGTATLGASLSSDDSRIASMLALNMRAVERLSLAVSAPFVARDRGTIVNIGSILGLHALASSTSYSATKAFVNLFTRGLQGELAGTVQLVLPGATATGLWDISGVPLAALDPKIVMSAEQCVDAALAGLDQNELVTMPSLENAELLRAYEAAQLALFQGAQNGTPATRYHTSPTRSSSS
jgi:short-subunit dehydrogenase